MKEEEEVDEVISGLSSKPHDKVKYIKCVLTLVDRSPFTLAEPDASSAPSQISLKPSKEHSNLPSSPPNFITVRD